MGKIFNWISICFATVAGGISYLLGGFDTLLRVLVVLVILDYITGLLKARATQTISSKIGLIGIVKKIMMFAVVVLSFSLERVLGDAIALRDLTVTFFIANEGISLLENAAEFIPLPQALRDALLQIRGKDDKDEDN